MANPFGIDPSQLTEDDLRAMEGRARQIAGSPPKADPFGRPAPMQSPDQLSIPSQPDGPGPFGMQPDSAMPRDRYGLADQPIAPDLGPMPARPVRHPGFGWHRGGALERISGAINDPKDYADRVAYERAVADRQTKIQNYELQNERWKQQFDARRFADTADSLTSSREAEAAKDRRDAGKPQMMTLDQIAVYGTPEQKAAAEKWKKFERQPNYAPSYGDPYFDEDGNVFVPNHRTGELEPRPGVRGRFTKAGTPRADGGGKVNTTLWKQATSNVRAAQLRNGGDVLSEPDADAIGAEYEKLYGAAQQAATGATGRNKPESPAPSRPRGRAVAQAPRGIPDTAPGQTITYQGKPATVSRGVVYVE